MRPAKKSKRLNPRVIATIEARTGSSRLPGKVMMPIMGKPMLWHVIRRLQAAKRVDLVVVATTTNPEDEVIVRLAKRMGVGWYRGSEDDVLDRVLKAARKYRATHVAENHGDCPLVDPRLLDEGIRVALESQVDYLGNNTIKRSVPPGLDVQVFPLRVLEEVARLTKDPADREHVSLYIYHHPERFRLKHLDPPIRLPWRRVRLVVDTPRDLELVRRVYRLLYRKDRRFGFRQLSNLASRFPDFFKINCSTGRRRLKKKLKDYAPRYRAGIIGCGHIAGMFADDPKRSFISTHAEAYQLFPEIKLVAAADVDDRRLKAFGRRWGLSELYLDYQELLNRSQLEILSVCTRPDSHIEVVQKAIRAGIPKIICEKPMGLSAREAARVDRQAKKAGVSLVVNYNRRFDPVHRELMEMVKSGKLGKFSAGVFYYGNGFINNGCHAIDVVRMLLGEIKSVGCFGSETVGGVVNLDLVLTLAEGSRVVIQGVSGDNYIFEADFCFEKMRVRLEEVGRRRVMIPSVPNPRASRSRSFGGKSRITEGDIPQSLPEVLTHLFSLKQGQSVWSTAANAASALEVLTAAFLSRQRSGKEVTLPLSQAQKELMLDETAVSI